MTDSTPTQTPDAITFYWRPGCGFCMMLDRKLTKLGIPMDKRNIWDDPEHAATVRTHADGTETVPTVVIGDVAMVNPPAAAVLAAIRTEAPHLEPDEPSAESGLLDRVLGR
ncbi:MAG: NrdH-redoxin [Acidimicrobiales bacterium]|nr:NrdH-redoxin [Acidimicrobiales bacterium]